jgi:hypothetical protein
MKTRKAIFLALLVIAVAVVVWFYIRRPPDQAAVQPATVETKQTDEAKQTPVAPAPVQKRQAAASPTVASQPAPENNPAALIERRRNQMEEERQRGLNEWRTPIEFYGKVIDENTNPVAGADIHFEWTDLSPKGNSEKAATSDANGLFSLQNEAGKHLIVQVSKPGYYAYQPVGAAFSYAGENQNFVPDAANPVVFRLKKKGVAEPLVVLDKTLPISISGKPLELDLKTGKVASPGQETVIMEFVKRAPENPDDRLYDWSFRITVPNGGLVLSTNEFAFSAPEQGYEPSDLVEMKSSLGDDWQSRMRREYFLKLPDGNFARVVLDLMSHNGSLKVQAFVNPSGSRNLEFDPQQTANSP